MYSTLSYLIISELAALLDTWVGTISLVVSMTVFLLLFGVLLCVLVRRGNRQEKRLETTAIIPSVRAGKLRRRYL